MSDKFKSFPCVFCLRVLRSSRGLTQHINAHHPILSSDSDSGDEACTETLYHPHLTGMYTTSTFSCITLNLLAIYNHIQRKSQTQRETLFRSITGLRHIVNSTEKTPFIPLKTGLPSTGLIIILSNSNHPRARSTGDSTCGLQQRYRVQEPDIVTVYHGHQLKSSTTQLTTFRSVLLRSRRSSLSMMDLCHQTRQHG